MTKIFINCCLVTFVFYLHSLPGVFHQSFLKISYSRHMVSPTFAHTHPTPLYTHPCPSSTIQLGALSVDLHPCRHPSVSCSGRCYPGTAARREVRCHHYDRAQRLANQMWRFGSQCVGVGLSQAAFGLFGDFSGPRFHLPAPSFSQLQKIFTPRQGNVYFLSLSV